MLSDCVSSIFFSLRQLLLQILPLVSDWNNSEDVFLHLPGTKQEVTKSTLWDTEL